jgi:hypothetical protein
MKRQVVAAVFWCSIAANVATAVSVFAQDEVAKDSTRQYAPCPSQSRSVQELVSAFEGGQFPDASRLSGSWVAIGFVNGSPSLNCDGLIRGPAFEWVMVADRDSIEIDMIGMPSQTWALKFEARDSIAFPVDFGGDSLAEYRCRLTDQKTLACLSGRGEWVYGVEFRKMSVRQNQRGTSVAQPDWTQSEFRSERFTTSDGVELHFLEAGSGPALVFVPGFTAPAEIWEPQLRHFAASNRVIALDPRSQGRSEKATEGHYLARRGRDIGELIKHVGAAPAVVVGWSSGVLELLSYVQESGTAALRAVVLVDMYIGVNTEPGQLHPFAPLWTTWIEEIQVNRRAWTREWVRSMFASEPPTARSSISTMTSMCRCRGRASSASVARSRIGIDRMISSALPFQPW